MPEVFLFSFIKEEVAPLPFFLPTQIMDSGFFRMRGYGTSCDHIPLSLCLSEALRLRIASGGYDCRRECALHPGTVPLTSNHSFRKIGCLDGLCIGAQPLRGRHTPSRHHVVFRLPSVTCLHYGKPSDNIIIRTTASSDLQVLPGTKTVRSLHCIPLASSSLAASIIPPYKKRCKHIILSPPQAPRRLKGQCWKP